MASDKRKETKPSKVARISRLIANEGKGYLYHGETKKKEEFLMPQITYYQSGVGAGDHLPMDHLWQGAFLTIKH